MGGRGGQGSFLDIEIISKNRLFFQFRRVKTKFHHFWYPFQKFWENPLLAPSRKKFFRRLCLVSYAHDIGKLNQHDAISDIKLQFNQGFFKVF